MLDFIASLGPAVPGHHPVPRHRLDREAWIALVLRLGEEPGWTLLGEWAEQDRVHCCLCDEAGHVVVATLDCPEGRFPSLSLARPGAVRLERAIQDLFGLNAEALTDPRPWLDHDAWPVRLPLSAAPPPPLGNPEPYPFLPAEGEGLHVIPFGPVHGTVAEPTHLRLTAHGETIVRFEARLGFAHRGIESLVVGRGVEAAARLVARLSGDSTVAHALAFAQAVEAATGTAPPPRAVWLRALLAELERIANHLGDFGATCGEAGVPFIEAECALLRERVAVAAEAAFGHRLMMDRVVPGGVAVDLTAEAAHEIDAALQAVRDGFLPLVRLYDARESLQDRTVGTGCVARDQAMRFGAGGFVGRACGLGRDARRLPGYAPYPELAFEIPVAEEGDADARLSVRAREVVESLSLAEQILDRLPDGPVLAAVDACAGEGLALVESFRGEVMTWVRLAEDGTILRCHPRDPSWLQWPLLEAAIERSAVSDLSLCYRSFNCTCAGHDL
ncbi:hydrogenase large subunit [Arenibaculum pallidiluteum]|uniref:hydrogenase large subunit n=1 Tax=Arenibaculum pallidiluteum TaxID=2812559 RepID=UPI001A95C531|nr:nickel-dependent hydrogenase large subunit [Arenibaculum pallidiluteum]